MVKNLEQYLSELDFDLPDSGNGAPALASAEKVFIEKYLGLDALDAIPRIDPPQAQPVQVLLKPRPEPPVIEVVPDRPSETASEPPLTVRIDAPEPVLQEPAAVAAQVLLADAAPGPVIEVVSSADEEVPDDKPDQSAPAPTPVAVETPSAKSNAPEPELASPPPQPAPAACTLPVLRDLLRDKDEIQVVSFFVAGQLFLLPVEGIQEVLRHMEIVKVPKAPEYVAGVINLRGHITPLVHLSTLLTTASEPVYDERNFVIIYGSDESRLGLIIDRISSMHMLPQDKIIWNVESKVGDAAECLAALANLDDRVCGVVAPDIIFQKLISPATVA